jgi:uncharacterized membrane protein
MPVALGAIVIVGAVVRLWRLGAGSLSFDESFTAMVGRLPLPAIFGFLRAHDSHPPLDYLLQLPLARAGVSPFWFRLPAALCSIGALALFAWWMRDRGRAGIAAVAAMAVCAFQISYGREARMYGPMELIGVGSAVVADSWLRAPRRRHAVIAGALTFVGLMTHVSMLLLAVGLVALAGRRRDSDAWRWRAGIAAGAAGWALLWGPSFLVQSRGGHSSWIPHTTPIRFVETVASLVAARPAISGIVVAAIVAGGVVCRRRDRQLALVMACCFALPVTLAAAIGLRAPVLLDRTLTVAAWGPLLAVGYLADALCRRARSLGAAAVALAALVMLVSIPHALRTSGPTAALTELESVTRSGDVIAVQPATKAVELYWTFAVRGDDGTARAVQVPGMNNAVALALTGRRPTGRIWLLQYTDRPLDLRHQRLCARPWHHGPTRMLCIRHDFTAGFPRSWSPTIAAVQPRVTARARRATDSES